MLEYQPLTAEIQVPKEWPVELAQSVIVDVVKMGIDRHLLGQTVIVIVNNVSALITKNETRAGYFLERTEDIDDEEAYWVELLMPAKAVMIAHNPNGRKHCEPQSVQMLPSNLRFDYPVSRMFVKRSNRHEVVTLVPNIEKILSLKGITGPEIYNHVLKVTYKMQNFSCLDYSEPKQKGELPKSARLFVSVERVTDSEWEVACFERVMPPRTYRWRRVTCNCKTAFTWITLLLGAVFFVLLIYYLVRGI